MEHLFHGDPAPPMTVPTLTEPALDNGRVQACDISLEEQKEP